MGTTVGEPSGDTNLDMTKTGKLLAPSMTLIESGYSL
jgi:hypothetical protein